MNHEAVDTYALPDGYGPRREYICMLADEERISVGESVDLLLKLDMLAQISLMSDEVKKMVKPRIVGFGNDRTIP